MFMNGGKSGKQEAVKMLKQAAKTQKIKTVQKNTHAQRKRGMHTTCEQKQWNVCIASLYGENYLVSNLTYKDDSADSDINVD